MMPETSRRKQRSFWVELPILLLVAVIVAVLVRTFLVQTFYIPSGSMETTLLINDRVLVNKMVYRFREPRRGEVVVFVPPKQWDAGPTKDDYIKRVVGVGGDKIVCCDSAGRITINGKVLQEDYLFEDDVPSAQPFDVSVPTGRLFVMGDHRSSSADSRYHTDYQVGTIPVDAVVGRAFVIFWPFSHVGTLSVPKGYEAIPAPSGG
ncbi:signal peptidase I [Cryptosporangium arvum]|uniref:signal peptidase I n=1 Tax=Cryptosporangium arvum TaxID=80871 RepID=UPI0004AD4F31